MMVLLSAMLIVSCDNKTKEPEAVTLVFRFPKNVSYVSTLTVAVGEKSYDFTYSEGTEDGDYVVFTKVIEDDVKAGTYDVKVTTKEADGTACGGEYNKKAMNFVQGVNTVEVPLDDVYEFTAPTATIVSDTAVFSSDGKLTASVYISSGVIGTLHYTTDGTPATKKSPVVSSNPMTLTGVENGTVINVYRESIDDDWTTGEYTATLTLDIDAIGLKGPAGGWVFYDIDADNDSGDADGLNSATAGWRYLEAADADLSGTFKWRVGSLDATGATGTAIGTGKSNTEKLSTDAYPAAQACRDYGNGTAFDDWFLPSYEEIKAMYSTLKNPDKGGTWEEGVYWSSSEKSSDSTYFYNTIFGQGSSGPGNTNYVRPCRSF